MSAGLLTIVNAVLPGFLTVCVFRLIAPRTEGTGTMLVATALAWNVVIDALVQVPAALGTAELPAYLDDWLNFLVAAALGFLAAKAWSSSRIHRWLQRLRVTNVGPHARIDAGMFALARTHKWVSVIHVKDEGKPIYGIVHSWSIQEQGGGIGVRTRRPSTAKPDERYQDTRTVEHVYLPLQEVRKVEFVDPEPTKEESA